MHFVKRKHFDDTENDDHGHQGRQHSNREAECGPRDQGVSHALASANGLGRAECVQIQQTQQGH